MASSFIISAPALMELTLPASADAYLPQVVSSPWTPELFWLHAIADSLTGIAYLVILATLLFFAIRARRVAARSPEDAVVGLPHPGMMPWFGLFFLACGATHLVAVYTLWSPAPGWSGAVKGAAALVSAATAIALVPLVPRMLDVYRAALDGERHRLDSERLAAALADARRRLRHAELVPMLDAAPVGMLLVARDGRIQQANAACESLFGYPRRGLVGRNVDALVPDRVRAGHAALRSAFFENPESRPLGPGRDLAGRRRSGAEFPVEIAVTPMETVKGPMVVATVVDLTLRKKAERELHRSNAALEQFAYAASHDLQEPLRGIATFAQLLAEKYEGQLDAEADEYIKIIVDDARRMRSLVRDLLAYSRAGSATVPRAATDIGAVLEGVRDDVRQAVTETGATIEGIDLPTVHANHVEIAVVLRNLITNALKYRSDAPPVITVSAERGAGAWIVSVADNGIGIETQSQERIFQLFQRLHARNPEMGTGIGLALCRRIVNAMDGEIRVESEVGVGSRFSFTIPDPIPDSVEGDVPA